MGCNWTKKREEGKQSTGFVIVVVILAVPNESYFRSVQAILERRFFIYVKRYYYHINVSWEGDGNAEAEWKSERVNEWKRERDKERMKGNWGEKERNECKREKEYENEENQDKAHESEKNELKRKRDTARVEVNLRPR